MSKQSSPNPFAAFAREAAYVPPPDQDAAPLSGSRASWFPSRSNATNTTASYQNGGIPSFGDSYGAGYGAGIGSEEDGLLGGGGAGGSGTNEWETRFGWRVDFEAAVAYILGPVSALLLLILEVKNDYVRFHAYQSALYSTSLLVLQFIFRFIFPRWLSILILVLFCVSLVLLAVRAYHDANSSSIGQGGIVRYHIPYLGDFADRWVSEE